MKPYHRIAAPRLSEFLGILFAPLWISAQVEQAWVTRLEGLGWSSGANAVAVDAGGNLYITGYIAISTNRSDFLTAKFDPTRRQVWMAIYDGPANSGDEAIAIAVDAVGQVYVCGSSYGSAGSSDFALVKYAADGHQLWAARYEGSGEFESDDYPTGLAIDSAGNVLVTGVSARWADEPPWIRATFATVKYDSEGNQLWVATYASVDSHSDSPVGVRVDEEGNVYVGGNSFSYARGLEYVVVKYGPAGNLLWAARYDDPVFSLDYAKALGLDGAGNVYVLGTATESSTGSDYATVKFDTNGNRLWVARYSTPGEEHDAAARMIVDGPGNVWITGTSRGDSITVNYDATGALLWASRFDGTSPDDTRDLAVDDQGNAYLTSLRALDSGVDFSTVKYDAEGRQRWVTRYNASPPSLNAAVRLAVDGAGNLFVTGASTNLTGWDVVIVKYAQTNVIGLPELQSWPRSQSVPRGTAVSFTAVATGNPPLNYQWRKNGVAISGATSSTLTLGYVQPFADADYSVEVRNTLGSVVSPEARLTVLYAPVVTNQPSPTSQDAIVGDQVVFSGRGAGTLPLRYQWRFNGAPLPGATGSALTLSNVSVAATGDYDFVVTNITGAATSRVAQLTVYPNVRLAWSAGYVGPHQDNHTAIGLGVDAAGNVYVTGRSVASVPSGVTPHSDYATLKYLPEGTLVWANRYNGPANADDFPTAIAVDSVGNVFVTGGSRRPGLPTDFATVSYDTAGGTRWTARYAGVNNADAFSAGLSLDGAGNLYVGSSSSSAYATVKYDAHGNTLWTALHSGDYSGPAAVAADAAGNVYVTGSSGTVKYDPTGAQLWVATQAGVRIIANASGEVYVLAPSSQLTKLRANGTRLWSATHAGMGAALAVGPGDTVYVGSRGAAYPSGSDADYITQKYDRDGHTLWIARYNGPANSDDVLADLAVDSAGNVYVTGSSVGLGTGKDFATVKYGPSGSQLWVARHNKFDTDDDTPVSLKLDPSNNVLVTGSTGDEYSHDYLTVKYSQTNVVGTPVILTPPQDQAGLTGTNATFSVTASGTPPLTYQWRFNGRIIPNATGSIHTASSAGGYAVEVRNLVGLALSPEARLTLYDRPQITRGPFDHTETEGFDHSLYVDASGTWPLSYQWYFNGTPLVGATNFFLFLSGITTNQAGGYSVVVSNVVGSVTSQVATLTVIPRDPVLDHWQWRNPSWKISDLTAVAYGNGLFVAVGGATNIFTSVDGSEWAPQNSQQTNRYVTLAAVTSGNGRFVVVGDRGTALVSSDGTNWVSHTAGAADRLSAVAYGNGRFVAIEGWGDVTLTSVDGINWTRRAVTPLLGLTSVAYGNGVFAATGYRGANESVILTSRDGENWIQQVLASPDFVGSIAYGKGLFVAVGWSTWRSADGNQWIRGGEFPRGLGFQPYSLTYGHGIFVAVGGDSYDGLILTSTDGVNWAQRNIAAANALTGVAYGRGAFVAVGPSGELFQTPQFDPALLNQPQYQFVPPESSVTFSVAATGTEPMSFQWRFDGNDLPGATNATLVIPQARRADAGDYSVRVTNSLGSDLSDPATLELHLAPVILEQPQGWTVLAGTNVAFHVAAYSLSDISYQWCLNGTNLPNATNATLVLTKTRPDDDGVYSVILTDNAGSTQSDPARLTVLYAPDMIRPIPPLRLTVVPGETVTLSAALRGPTPIFARWRRFKPDGTYGGIVADRLVNTNVAFLVLTNISTNMAGTYTLSLTNFVGSNLNTLRTNAFLTLLLDRDSDRLPDDWELAHALNPDDPSDANLDSDGDTVSNRHEYIAGTDPQDPQSYLRVDAIDQAGDSALVRLRFLAVSNRTYSIQWCGALEAGAWNRLTDVVAEANTRVIEISDMRPGTPEPRRFYRLTTPRLP